MQNEIRRKYAFVLPLPLNHPSSKATLYGISYVIADENLNLVGNRELITCRGLDNLLPSPNYLFSQGIDPFSIKKALTEEQFLSELKDKIFTPETTVITWSIRNLKILEQICIRNLHKPDLLKKAYCVCDVNRILKLHEMLETGSPFRSDALNACAKKYGFTDKIEKNAQVERLNLLIYLFRTLSQINAPLLRFALRSSTARIEALEKAISDGKYLLEYDLSTRSLEIIKPIELLEDSLNALYYDGKDVLYKSYELTDFGILSPATVLTAQRENTVNLSLKVAIEALEQATELTETQNLSEYQSFLSKLNDQELIHFQNTLTEQNRAFIRADSNFSDTYRRYLLMFAGNNYKETLTDNELQNYYKLCSSQIQSQLKQYMRELENLMANADENNAQDVSLLRRIQSYPMEL